MKYQYSHYNSDASVMVVSSSAGTKFENPIPRQI
jgi:hypothetical protein